MSASVCLHVCERVSDCVCVCLRVCLRVCLHLCVCARSDSMQMEAGQSEADVTDSVRKSQGPEVIWEGSKSKRKLVSHFNRSATGAAWSGTGSLLYPTETGADSCSTFERRSAVLTSSVETCISFAFRLL